MSDEASHSKKWKKHLLGSSLPLEYEVAKLLVKEKFVVKADYTYTRKSEGQDKEFSVDIHATGYVPFDDDKIEARVELLIECKHRSPEKKWVFLVEPNNNEFSPISYTTFRVCDTISSYEMPSKELCKLDGALTGVYKGTEVNLADGGTTDADLKSGISQLRYALPDLIAEAAWHNDMCHPTASVPVVVVAVLVTNAEIYVANEDFSVEAVKGAEEIGDFAKKEDCVLFYSPQGPDFENHLWGKVQRFISSKRLKDGGLLFEKRAKGTKDAWVGSAFSHQQFTHFVVCSMDALPSFIKAFKKAVKSDAKRREQVFSEEQIKEIIKQRKKGL